MRTILSLFAATFLSFSIMTQAQVELKYNLEKGKTYKVKSSMTMDQTTKMQGMEQNNTIENVSYFSLKALNMANDFFMAQVRFDTIFTSTTMPPMTITSANEGNIKSDKPEEIMGAIMNRLCKSTFLVKMAYSGHVIDIMNYDVMTKVIMADIDSIKGQMAMAIKPRVESMMEKKALKGMIESITVYLPNKEVKNGDKWNTQFTSYSGGFGSLSSTDYTLEKISKKEAVVKGEAKMEPVAGKPMVMNGAEITSELRGVGTSELIINPKTGWIKSGTSEIQMSGNLNVNAQGNQMQIPVEAKIKSETIELN